MRNRNAGKLVLLCHLALILLTLGLVSRVSLNTGQVDAEPQAGSHAPLVSSLSNRDTDHRIASSPEKRQQIKWRNPAFEPVLPPDFICLHCLTSASAVSPHLMQQGEDDLVSIGFLARAPPRLKIS